MDSQLQTPTKKDRARPILIGVSAALSSMLLVVIGGGLVLSIPSVYERFAPPLDLAEQPFQALLGQLDHDEDENLVLVPDNMRGAWHFRLPPSLLAERYATIEVTIENAPIFTQMEAFWGLRDRPDTDQRLPLTLESNTYTGDLTQARDHQGRPIWRDVILDIGIRTHRQPTGFVVKSIALHPPPPSIGAVLKRIWADWTTLEGYTTYTINGQRMAGREASFPIGLAAGLSLYLAWAMVWLWGRRKQPHFALLPALIAATITVWLATDIRWKREMIHETAAAWDTYAGKTLAEKRLAEPDAYLFEIAQKVIELIPEPPQRIQIVSTGDHAPGSSNFERTKLDYYLLPHNSLSIRRNLYRPGHRLASMPGAYVLVIDEEHPSWEMSDEGTISPGYPVEAIGEGKDFRLYRIREPEQ